MPGLAFPSVGPLGLGSPRSRPFGHRYYSRLRLPMVHPGWLRFVARTPGTLLLSLYFVSPLRARSPWGNARRAPGPFGKPVALAPAAYGREAMGSPKFPRYPCVYMPCSPTPVVSFLTCLSVRKDCCLPPRGRRRLSFSFGWGRYPFDHDDFYFGVPYHGLHTHYTRPRTLHY
jgi:hypothetical protein